MERIKKSLEDGGVNVQTNLRGETARIDSIELSETNIKLGKGQEGVSIEVIPIISGEKDYYVEINSAWYKLEVKNNELTIDENESTVSDEDVNMDLNGKISINIENTSVATGSITGNAIKIEPVDIGNTTITVLVEDVQNPATENITVVQLSTLKETTTDISNEKNLYLDGASLITVPLVDDTIATSNDVIFSSNNKDIAEVRENGIVMASKQIGTTKIICKGNDGELVYNVISTAKIVYTNNTNANTTFYGQTTDFSYKNPVIPVGFSAIDTNDAKWTNLQNDYNKGLVIMDSKGNQFVWVPVDGTKVNYELWCNCSFYGSSYTEAGGDFVPSGVIESDSSNQVKKYGGFYVGRYESGLDVDMGSTAQTTANAAARNINNVEPIVVEGAIPWNFIYYSYAKQNSEMIAPFGNQYVRSALITGKQWDTTMKFIQECGGKNSANNNINDSSTGWGNHYDSLLTLDRYPQISNDFGASWNNASTKNANSSYILRTGASTGTKVLNISDMAGNIYEWSSEYVQGYLSLVMYRGGAFNYQGIISAGFRTYHYTSGYSFDYVGYRVSLFVI